MGFKCPDCRSPDTKPHCQMPRPAASGRPSFASGGGRRQNVGHDHQEPHPAGSERLQAAAGTATSQK